MEERRADHRSSARILPALGMGRELGGRGRSRSRDTPKSLSRTSSRGTYRPRGEVDASPAAQVNGDAENVDLSIRHTQGVVTDAETGGSPRPDCNVTDVTDENGGMGSGGGFTARERGEERPTQEPCPACAGWLYWWEEGGPRVCAVCQPPTKLGAVCGWDEVPLPSSGGG